jgi:hypothetical protein
MSEAELDELDSVSTESICTSLVEQIHLLATAAEQVDTQFRTILRKVKHADVWDGDTLELTPKPGTATWLKEHGWTQPTIPFADFFTLFLKTAAALDIDQQRLCLHTAEAEMFHVGKDVSIYEVLRNLPLVFV